MYNNVYFLMFAMTFNVAYFRCFDGLFTILLFVLTYLFIISKHLFNLFTV